ncbi:MULTISPECIES: hypothetical protein [Listeria]|uniref:hypothetical protein n=1 Tax=Listeria TaxID=1637 RepID=UPI000B58CB8C|nr:MULTISPECIES: hypothetical protein [Listeria]
MKSRKIALIVFCSLLLISVFTVANYRETSPLAEKNAFASDDREQGKVRIAVFGEVNEISKWFAYSNVSASTSSADLQKFDALLITRDYLKKTNLSELREKLTSVGKIPILFFDFENTSAPAFMNSNITQFSALKMKDKGYVQLLCYFNKNNYVTFDTPTYDETAQAELAETIIKLNASGNIKKFDKAI